jgi:hypothetical protein
LKLPKILKVIKKIKSFIPTVNNNYATYNAVETIDSVKSHISVECYNSIGKCSIIADELQDEGSILQQCLKLYLNTRIIRVQGKLFLSLAYTCIYLFLCIT